MTGPRQEAHDRSGSGLILVSLLALAAGGAVGVVGGGFRWCLDRAGALRGDLWEWSHGLGDAGWLVPVAAVAAGAALAALIVRWMPLAAGSGIQHVEAVDRGEAPAPPLRLLPAKFVGGLLAIGSGLVLGREGPTVHMGAVIGAEAGRFGRRSDAEVRTLQTSLAGAGLAVAFNAPIGGALFVFEEVTKSWHPRTVFPTVVGVTAAVAVSRVILGDHPDFRVLDVPAPAMVLLPFFLVFGALTGVLGALYNRLVIGCLDAVALLPRVPMVAKAGVIGAVVGLALFLDPLSAGGGDQLAQLVVGGGAMALPLLLVYLAVRFVAGPVSYSAGTPGGLFAPLLAVGALWGALFAGVVAWIVPGSDVGVATAIVGMATFFAATVRAPFTGIVIVIEMTAITSVTLPMLASTVSAVLVAHLIGSRPIYDTLRLRMEKTGET